MAHKCLINKSRVVATSCSLDLISNKILANRIQQHIKGSYTMMKSGISQGCKDSSIFTNQSMQYPIVTN